LSASYDLIIVGAGVVGAACALECASKGFKTLILDRGSTAAGTTAAGMGHIVVMDDSEAQFALSRYSQHLWMQMQPQFPPQVAYNRCGTIWVAADAEEMEAVERKKSFYEAHGVAAHILGTNALESAEPNLRKGLAGGLLVPDDAVVYPICAAQFFIDQARQYGADVRMGACVQSLLPEGGVKLTDGSSIHAARTVNAAGPWAAELSADLPIRKRKGHLVITDREPGFVHHQLIELGYLKSAHSVSKDSIAFNVQPRETGQVLIGSSRQFDADDTTVDHTQVRRMLQRACEFMPTLKQLPSLRIWAGHRAATPDGLPVIGPDPRNNRIWHATGHEGLGITTSLGTGRLLAALLLNATPGIPASPYAPARFGHAMEEREHA
jgi:glycine/D-amino acid oxidase-like deaminating enzyme